jgi:GH15 family glucan-1,4-alpha-glucosidase
MALPHQRQQRVSGPLADTVDRSLITLKAATYARTGGIVAAPTTSLPEHIGGPRNWDYRFCWLRDATLTLLALMNAGYLEEARAWREWLLRAAAGKPNQLQIMNGIAGAATLAILPFENHGVGCVRSSDQKRRSIQPRGSA